MPKRVLPLSLRVDRSQKKPALFARQASDQAIHDLLGIALIDEYRAIEVRSAYSGRGSWDYVSFSYDE